jgi:hypothetical protein
MEEEYRCSYCDESLPSVHMCPKDCHRFDESLSERLHLKHEEDHVVGYYRMSIYNETDAEHDELYFCTTSCATMFLIHKVVPEEQFLCC